MNQLGGGDPYQPVSKAIPTIAEKNKSQQAKSRALCSTTHTLNYKHTRDQVGVVLIIQGLKVKDWTKQTWERGGVASMGTSSMA